MIALKFQGIPDVRCQFPFLDDDGVTYHHKCKTDVARVGATCRDIQGNWGYCKYRKGKEYQGELPIMHCLPKTHLPHNLINPALYWVINIVSEHYTEYNMVKALWNPRKK